MFRFFVFVLLFNLLIMALCRGITALEGNDTPGSMEDLANNELSTPSPQPKPELPDDPSLDEGGYWLSFAWGGFGSANSEFDTVFNLTVDQAGNIHVADGNNGRIQVFSHDGQFLHVWGKHDERENEEMLLFPGGIDIDRDGNFYVIDGATNRIHKFNAEGEFMTSILTPASQLWDITVTVDGKLYVTDPETNQVFKFSEEGNLLARWGADGHGKVKFGSPRGIASDRDNYIYIADFVDNKVHKFHPDGTLVISWETYSAEKGMLASPFDVDVDHSGYVYITDAINRRVQKFTGDGLYLTQFSTRSDQYEYALSRPFGLAIGPAGDIYVVESNFLERMRDPQVEQLIRILRFVPENRFGVNIHLSNH